jgi:hypothetical protein
VIRRGDIELDYDLGDLRETRAAVAVTLFRPGPDLAVLVVAASDVAAVEARLRPQLGESLCIVPSRWTNAELDAVGDYLHRHHEQWALYQWGPQNTGDGQAHMAARLVRVLPEIAACAATLPRHLAATAVADASDSYDSRVSGSHLVSCRSQVGRGSRHTWQASCVRLPWEVGVVPVSRRRLVRNPAPSGTDVRGGVVSLK